MPDPVKPVQGPHEARPRHSGWLGVLALGACYTLSSVVSLYMSLQPGSMATIWYANAVAIAWVAFSPWRLAPLLVLFMAVGNALANLVVGADPLEILLFVPANAAEVLLGGWLLHRAGLTATGISTPKRLLALLTYGGLVPLLAGATLGAVLLSSAGMGTLGDVWLVWFEGSVIGSVSMLPLAFVLLGAWTQGRSIQLWQAPLFALLMVTVGVTVLSMAYLPFPFVYVVMPLLMAALLLPLEGALLVTLAASITIATMQALGILVPPPVTYTWQQGFFYMAYAAALVPAQVLAAALAELRDSHAQLEQKTIELKQANEGLEQFVRIASHDLREPLNTVVQFANLLASDHGPALPPSGQRYLKLVHQAGMRMRTLLDDVLRFARLKVGETEAPMPVSLEQTMDELRDAMAARLQATQAELTIGPLPVVLGHASLLSLLFQNLMGNALKFVPPGRAPRITVTAQTADGFVWVTVADNGIGMEAQEIGKLFQPFQRLHLRREYEGNGLGLSLCQHIAQTHGGSISVRSVLGEGSRFVVKLPLA
ncbi:MAG: ATP-binding protein [Hydrogenophaga sp.]|uniref:ATP-binding protein n=1 Tax=Hydrogenophaga sp. TaxID=1904254 RepID=UPI0027216368|nr:ATP-binding protein [Hydrogenophaga sp.]MDO9480706.1 ATP-binding protein [Hydrogenophaga sp.]MDP3343735.1 ATP-binding protein [Hydrogenophaga sp.]MDP3807131.1 ATP-binding protein [Hydrogenophaga sp.]